MRAICSPKGQTHREVGTQNHGTHAVSRATDPKGPFMRRSTKFLGAIAGAGILFTAAVSPAMADDVTSTVSGGALTASTAGASLSGVTLDGSGTQTATGASTPWTLTDARGSGAAWNLSVTATAPTSAAGTVDTTARTIPVGNLTILPGTITPVGTADPVSTTLTAPTLAMTGSAQALVSSTGTNSGSYNVTPTYSLAIPANTFRSNWPGVVGTGSANPYVSTLTYTIG